MFRDNKNADLTNEMKNWKTFTNETNFSMK